MHESCLDWLDTTRALTAFMYLALGSGAITSDKAESILRVVEDLNADSQARLYDSPMLLYYARTLAERMVEPLCDHPGPHEDEFEPRPVQ